MEAPLPADEPARLLDLFSLGLLDRHPNECFDRVTRLASRMFDVPIALVSLVDENRQWFASRQGLGATETPRCDAFCAHAILDSEPLVIENAPNDPRFSENPLVVGDPFIRFYAGAPIRSPRGHRLGTLCIIDTEPRAMDVDELRYLRDLADLVETEISQVGMANSDALTGLANRRGFIDAGTRMLALGQQRNEPVAILYADVDRLKPVNDNLGHAAGDALLQRASRVLESVVRTSDLAARVGGDEFAILLYDTDESGATMVADRIRGAVQLDNDHATDDCTLSLSVGVAAAGPTERLIDVIERADHRMFEAKRSASVD